jgi:hypothetical protein
MRLLTVMKWLLTTHIHIVKTGFFYAIVMFPQGCEISAKKLPLVKIFTIRRMAFACSAVSTENRVWAGNEKNELSSRGTRIKIPVGVIKFLISENINAGFLQSRNTLAAAICDNHPVPYALAAA